MGKGIRKKFFKSITLLILGTDFSEEVGEQLILIDCEIYFIIFFYYCVFSVTPLYWPIFITNKQILYLE